MSSTGYKDRLRSDIEGWISRGHLTRDGADAILSEIDEERAAPAFAIAAAILGAAGLIALVAANWQDIAPLARVGGLVLLNAVVLAICLDARLRLPDGSWRTEISGTLSIVVAGVSLALAAQAYNLPINWPIFGVVWSVVAATTALAARSVGSVWLGSAVLVLYVSGQHFGWHAGAISEIIFAILAILLLGVAVSHRTVRSGPWTIFASLVPMVAWTSGLPTEEFGSSALFAPSVLVIAGVMHKLYPPYGCYERTDQALSAAIGAVVILQLILRFGEVIVVAHPDWMYAYFLCGGGIAVAVAGAFYGDRENCVSGLLLLAAVVAPFAYSLVTAWLGSSAPSARSEAAFFFVFGLPLVCIAAEASISRRRKTFAAACLALIAGCVGHVFVTDSLVAAAALLLGCGVVLGGGALVLRKWRRL